MYVIAKVCGSVDVCVFVYGAFLLFLFLNGTAKKEMSK